MALPLEVMSINAHCPLLDLGTISERRKQAMQKALLLHHPTIVFFQEFKWPKITGITWSKYPIPRYFKYTGSRDASMMFDTRNTAVENVNKQDLQKIVDYLKLMPFNRLHDRFPIDYDPLPKMCMRIVRTKGTSLDIRFMCISWNGKVQDLTTLGRARELRYLMEFLRHVKDGVKIPILIAGNFGLTIAQIELVLKPPFKLYRHHFTARKTSPLMKDFVIASDDLNLSNLSAVELNLLPGIKGADVVLDHDPIVARINHVYSV